MTPYFVFKNSRIWSYTWCPQETALFIST